MAMSMGMFRAPARRRPLKFVRVKYFNTTIRGAGIFLPANKAYKRPSPRASQQGSSPLTGNTSLSSFNIGGRTEKTNGTPSLSKFSQSVGAGRSGARSPEAKPKSRPSLPRPESPLRKTQAGAASTPIGRPSLGNPKLAKSMMGGPRYAPSPTPGRFGASVGASAGDPGKRFPITPKSNLKKGINGDASALSGARSESRNELGPEPMFDSESDNTPVAASRTTRNAKPTNPQARPVSTQDDEIRRLRTELADRDQQLEKQAADIEEMHHSVNELQSNAPLSATSTRHSRGSGLEELDPNSLRALVREKNEKIRRLTEDFDKHRADFRDTIDVLERTSDETNRLHQEKIDNLQAELQELQDVHQEKVDNLQAENQGLQDRMDGGEDFDAMTGTLKILDEQVQELEEGLEDARRGEAEARGEAEFLRGEVERGKAELAREKQASASKVAQESSEGAVPPELARELKKREDEIKGLRAIIHSLSQSESAEKGSPRSSRRISKRRDSGQAQNSSQVNEQQLAEMRQGQEKMAKEVKDLQDLVDSKTYREEELENEIARLRKTTAHISTHSNGYSERTTRPSSKHRATDASNPSIDWNERGSAAKFRGSDDFVDAVATLNPRHSHDKVPATPESDRPSTTMTDEANLWCDLCDSAGHDILHCNNMGSGTDTTRHAHNESGNTIPQSITSAPRVKTDVSDHESHHTSPAKVTASSHPPYNSFNTLHSPSSPPATAPPPTTGLSAVAPPKQQPAPAPSMSHLMDSGLVPGKSSGVADGDKWCAICERDGHDATDCPFENQF